MISHLTLQKFSFFFLLFFFPFLGCSRSYHIMGVYSVSSFSSLLFSVIYVPIISFSVYIYKYIYIHTGCVPVMSYHVSSCCTHPTYRLSLFFFFSFLFLSTHLSNTCISDDQGLNPGSGCRTFFFESLSLFLSTNHPLYQRKNRTIFLKNGILMITEYLLLLVWGWNLNLNLNLNLT
jgi:hypothetical protein